MKLRLCLHILSCLFGHAAGGSLSPSRLPTLWTDLSDTVRTVRIVGSLRRSQPSALLLTEDSGAAGSKDMGSILQLSPSADHKRPILTVQLMGGLGNQLFQVAALVSAGLNLSPAFSVALPDVPGVCCNRSTYWHSVLRKLGPLLLQGLQKAAPTGGQTPSKPAGGKCLVEQVPGFDAYDGNCSAGTTWSASWTSRLHDIVSCPTVKLYGYFQHPAYFAAHLPTLRRAFWNEEIAVKAKANLEALLPGADPEHPIVSVHYRLGDYEHNGWVLDSDYYDAALLQVSRRLAPVKLRCLIFSDEPERAWAKAELLQGCAEKVLAKQDDTATSFHMMSLAQASVIADSTFSYWAALLGNKKEVVVAPGLQGQCWSYLQGVSGDSAWLQVATRTLSAQELLAQDILGSFSPPDE